MRTICGTILAAAVALCVGAAAGWFAGGVKIGKMCILCRHENL